MMRHGKGIAALAGLILALALLYGLGAALREGWSAVTRGPVEMQLSGDFVLNAPYDGDLTVFARTIRLEPEARVSGAASLVGEQVIVQGEVDGDLSATAANIRLEPTSRVGGRAVLTGDTVTVEGAVGGGLVLSASKADLGPTSAVGGAVQVCAGATSDQRVNATPLASCAPESWQSPASSAAAPLTALTIAAVLAGGVLSALPFAAAPGWMARAAQQVRERPLRLLLTGALALVLWGVLGVLVALLSGGVPGQLLVILFTGASALLGAPLIWLGVSLVSLWIGAALARLVRRPQLADPFKALPGGLILSAALALIGPFSAPGLLLLGALAVVGLAAFSARRTALASPGGPHRASYFVQG